MQLGELRIHAGDTIRFDSFVSGRDEATVYQTQDGMLFVYARTVHGTLIVPVSGLGQRHIEVLSPTSFTED